MSDFIPATDVALVLETNNLASGDADAVVTSLARLLLRLRAQTMPLADLGALVITHDGLDASAQSRLEAVAGRSITFVALAPGTGYYDAKNAGFDATTTPIVAFGDADCWPDPRWLQALVTPLGLGWHVAAGRTTYREGALGEALSSIDFMYFRERGGSTTRNFYANNVAFRREVFEAHRYGDAPMYRGACQLLGMRLHRAGVPVRYVDHAHTVHRLPDDWREVLELRLRRGQDLRDLAPHVVESVLPPVVPTRREPSRALAGLVLAGRWLYSRKYVRGHATTRRERATRLALMTGVAGLDALGALGPTRRHVEGALSYHADVDRLRAA